MNINIGKTEKYIRLALGAIIIGVGVFYQSWWGALGLIPLVTGAISFCPIWRLLGINTCKNAR